MRHLKKIIACGMIVSGCASNPDVTIRYYLPETEVSIRVVRTATCNAQDELIVSSAPTVAARHFANLREPKDIKFSELDGAFANTDFAVEFYDDGRLKGVNATSTGQGEAILKSTVSLASALGLFGVPARPVLCDEINGSAKKKDGTKVRDKTKTVVFKKDSVALTENKPTPIPITQEDRRRISHDLLTALGSVVAQVGSASTTLPPLSQNNPGNHTLLEMRQPARVGLTVTARDFEIWKGTVAVSQLGQEFKAPIPKAALFGKQGFVLAVSPGGAITKIGYGKETGVVQTLSSGALLADKLRDTPAEKAAEAKAEADLIAQQQRLVRCIADPTECK